MLHDRALSADEETLFQQIAGLMAYGISQTQIAETLGLSDGRISQIKVDPRFAPFHAEALAENLGKNKELDDGWDSIERQALTVVIDNLKYNKDPEFALKAASLANRANRRGKSTVIDPQRAGDRVVINLNQAFVTRMQEVQTTPKSTTILDVDAEPKPREKKQQDLLSPKSLERLLKSPEETIMGELVDSLLPGPAGQYV